MSAIENLREVYVEELRDLWSANDQMGGVVKTFAKKAHDAVLRGLFEKSLSGIDTHTETLKGLIDRAGGKHAKDHCKGMQGLVAEAKKHGLDADIDDPDARDLALVAQYQRMSHYGLAGFGTAKAYAQALGRAEDEAKLASVVRDIYDADAFASHLAERSMKLALKAA